MSALIKHGAADAIPVEQLDWPAAARNTARAEPVENPLEAEIAALKQELAAAEAAHKKALIAAREKGRADAEAAFVRDEEKALALLREGIETTAAATRQKIAALDALALLLCQTALEKVFADAADFSDLITRAIRRQMINLRNGALLRVCVSARDFTDDAALAALRAGLGERHFEIVRDPDLVSGACRMDLRLGHIDLNVSEHWEALRANLRAFAATRASP